MRNADSSFEWPIAHPILPEMSVATAVTQRGLWIDLLNGLEALSHNLPHDAAARFLSVLSKASGTNDPLNVVSSASLESLRSLGATAAPEINSFLISSFAQPELPEGQVIPSLLLLSAKYDALPRAVLAQALEPQRPWAVQRSALMAIYGIGDLALVTPNEIDATWRLARQSQVVQITPTISGSGTTTNRAYDDPTPLAIYALGRLIYNPKGTRHEGSSRSGLSLQDKEINAFVLDKIQDADYAKSHFAAKAIKDSQDLTAFRELVNSVSSSTNEVAKVRMIDAIGMIGFDGGVDVLQALVIPTGQSDDVRHHALISLSKIGTERAAMVLSRVLSEQNSDSAAVALGRLGGQFALETLQKTFFNAFTTSPEFLDNVLQAIKSAEKGEVKVSPKTLLSRINAYSSTDATKYARLKKAYNRVFGPMATP